MKREELKQEEMWQEEMQEKEAKQGTMKQQRDGMMRRRFRMNCRIGFSRRLEKRLRRERN